MKQRLIFWLIGFFGPIVVRFLGITCRYKLVNEIYEAEALAQGKGVIYALWHGRMALPAYHFRNRGISVLISRSRDGELITNVVKRLGYVTRRGSPKVGGHEGFTDMLHDLKNGNSVTLFPDGPTGPRHRVKDGMFHLARLSGAPILPLSYAAFPAWKFNSWDGFVLMKPFSRGVIVFGRPFVIDRHLSTENSIESERLRIQERLCEVENQADDIVNSIDK